VREIKRVILHCTATKEGQDISLETIRGWHVVGNGWQDIGYHYVILLNGEIALGRNLFTQGAHTRGENEDSIGVAYVGGLDEKGKPKDTMSLYQDIAFMRLFESLSVTFGKLDLHGHNEFSNKACPSFDVQSKYKFLIKE
tara:strand:- start:161 stop:580 length:420 start_codon:yes stop_codon:yes gene_type:complete